MVPVANKPRVLTNGRFAARGCVRQIRTCRIWY
jgi:hypothetical protein